MTLPTYDQILLPLLEYIKDDKLYKVSDISDEIRDKYFQLTDEEKKIKVSNGKTKFHDRLTWARTYLKKAGLVEDPERGFVRISNEGKKLLNSGIKEITLETLNQYSSFKEFKQRTPKNDTNDMNFSDDLSPTDLIESGFNKIEASLKVDLLERLKEVNPYYFEKIILKLLNKMGYGSFKETSKSGDGGIDGIINQDELGLEKIYIQCKRFNSNNVREPDIRNFIGAMSSESTKGIFVTTSNFDKKAIEKARLASHKIILINGEYLAGLMIKHNVGIQIKETLEIKELDEDFFIDE